MRPTLATYFLSMAFCALLSMPMQVQGQDTEMARKKCVEFGFKDKTASHENCVKQFSTSMARDVTSKPVAAPAAPELTDAQHEEKNWDDAKSANNTEAFEAYLQRYPRGRFSGLAKANLLRLGAASVSVNALPIRAPNAEGSAQKASGPSASYGDKVRDKVKPNIVFTEDIAGNPVAEVEVRTKLDGTITSQRLIKTSGNKAWDDAAIKAIIRTETLPRDTDGRVPTPLIIEFRPRE
jgi:TolA protein